MLATASPTHVRMSAAIPFHVSPDAGDATRRDSRPARGELVMPTLDGRTKSPRRSTTYWTGRSQPSSTADPATTPPRSRARPRACLVVAATIGAQRGRHRRRAQPLRWPSTPTAVARAPRRDRIDVAGCNPDAAYRMKFRTTVSAASCATDRGARLARAPVTNERRFQTHRVHESLEPITDVGAHRTSFTIVSRRRASRREDREVRGGAPRIRRAGRRAGLWELTMRPAWRFVRTTS